MRWKLYASRFPKKSVHMDGMMHGVQTFSNTSRILKVI